MKYHTTSNPNLAVLVEDEGTTIAVVSTPNPNAEEVAKNLVEMQSLLAEWQAKVRKLERERDNYKRAYDEWTDKTEWVQQTAQSHELGMHRADVLKARIARAATQPVPRYKIDYLPDQGGERSILSEPGGIPDQEGDWVRYDDHAAALASASQPTPIGADASTEQCTIGVGDGTVSLFVHGDYVAIKRVQEIIFENERLRSDMASASHPAAVPPGYVLMPVEPSDKMVQAALHIDLSYMPGQDGADRAAVYRAMLAAAHKTASAPATTEGAIRNWPIEQGWMPPGAPARDLRNRPMA